MKFLEDVGGFLLVWAIYVAAGIAVAAFVEFVVPQRVKRAIGKALER